MSEAQQPNPFDRDPDAILRNTRFFDIGDKQVAYGNIYEDSKGRFPDGEQVKTSVVVDIQEDKFLTKSGTLYRFERRN
jgi:hypothetical protein